MSKLSQIQDIDLKLLRYFCAVVDEGGFSAAQAAMNMSQSMLSESIKTLELRLGTKLCQRGPKGFKLFPEGQEVYRAAKELFGSLDRFRNNIAEIGNAMSYDLVIGVQESVVENPASRLPEVLARFGRQFPNVRFILRAMLGTQVVGQVADGLIHVGISIVSRDFSHTTQLPLFDEVSTIYCGPEHPLFALPAEAVTRAMIDETPHCSSGGVETFLIGTEGEAAAAGDVGRGAASHLALILSGRNIGYVPDHIAAPFVAAGQLRALRPDLTRLRNPVCAIVGTATRDFRYARLFMAALEEVHRAAPCDPDSRRG